MIRFLLRHDQGELGPKTIDEWATPNGDEPLLIWMLREVEKSDGRVELVQVEDHAHGDYYAEVRP